MTTAAEWITKTDPSVLRASESELRRMTLYLDDVVDSLEGCPSMLRKLSAYDTKIKTLEGAPKIVERLDASHCAHLESLEGCPAVFDHLDVSYTPLKNFKGMPKRTSGTPNAPDLPRIIANDSDIVSLEGITEDLEVLNIENCRYLTSLSGIHKHVRACKRIWFTLSTACVQEALLGILLIDGVENVGDLERPDHPAFVILRSAMTQFDDKRKRVMWAQAELIKQLGEEGKRYAKL